jgi:hypothetical protein
MHLIYVTMFAWSAWYWYLIIASSIDKLPIRGNDLNNEIILRLPKPMKSNGCVLPFILCYNRSLMPTRMQWVLGRCTPFKVVAFWEVSGLFKSPKACESGRFSAEYDNLGFNPDIKSCTKILWGFVWLMARNGDFINLSPAWSVLIQ